MITERFELAPLLAMYGDVSAPRWHAEATATLTALAELLGVSRRSVSRWAHTGLTWQRADTTAVALGLHPCEIWPEYFDAVAVA